LDSLGKAQEDEACEYDEHGFPVLKRNIPLGKPITSDHVYKIQEELDREELEYHMKLAGRK
jgi:hypothetical protein